MNLPCFSSVTVTLCCAAHVSPSAHWKTLGRPLPAPLPHFLKYAYITISFSYAYLKGFTRGRSPSSPVMAAVQRPSLCSGRGTLDQRASHEGTSQRECGACKLDRASSKSEGHQQGRAAHHFVLHRLPSLGAMNICHIPCNVSPQHVEQDGLSHVVCIVPRCHLRHHHEVKHKAWRPDRRSQHPSICTRQRPLCRQYCQLLVSLCFFMVGHHTSRSLFENSAAHTHATAPTLSAFMSVAPRSRACRRNTPQKVQLLRVPTCTGKDGNAVCWTITPKNNRSTTAVAPLALGAGPTPIAHVLFPPLPKQRLTPTVALARPLLPCQKPRMHVYVSPHLRNYLVHRPTVQVAVRDHLRETSRVLFSAHALPQAQPCLVPSDLLRLACTLTA